MKSEIAVLLLTALHAASAAARGIIADYAGVIREAKVRADKHHHMDVPAMVGKQCQFELDNGAGSALRVQLVGYDIADVAALARSLWNAP